MITYYRTAIEDVIVLNKENKKEVLVKKGDRVLTSSMDKNGKVMVFSYGWANVDITLFDEDSRKRFT